LQGDVFRLGADDVHAAVADVVGAGVQGQEGGAGGQQEFGAHDDASFRVEIEEVNRRGVADAA
jgi:hypothetical protein